MKKHLSYILVILSLLSIAAAPLQQTKWIYRYVLVIPIVQTSPASIVAKDWDSDTGGDKTFSVRLSANGKEPATHLACETAMTAPMRTKMLTASVGAVNQIVHYDVNAGGTFDEVLVDLKLKRIEQEFQ